MFKIVRFPAELESFFAPLQDHFLFNHFSYFQDLVLAAAFSWERRNISALHRHLDADNQTHRSRFNSFLKVDRGNPEAALQDKAYDLLAALNPREGETIDLVIDGERSEPGREAFQ